MVSRNREGVASGGEREELPLQGPVGRPEFLRHFSENVSKAIVPLPVRTFGGSKEMFGPALETHLRVPGSRLT